MARFSVEDVLKPEVVRGFLDYLQRDIRCRRRSAAIVQQAREGTFVDTPADSRAPPATSPPLSFIRGLAQLQKKQYAQAAGWFQIALKGASDFLGAAFYLGAVHAAAGRDTDAIGAWQMSQHWRDSEAVYPMLVDALLRIGDAQAALDMIAEAPDAWPSDDERMRRVATAQAMLGQFAPALETLDAAAAPRPTMSICCSSRSRCSIGSTWRAPLAAEERASVRRLLQALPRGAKAPKRRWWRRGAGTCCAE